MVKETFKESQEKHTIVFSPTKIPSSMLKVNSTGKTKCALKGPQTLGMVTLRILAAESLRREDLEFKVSLVVQ